MARRINLVAYYLIQYRLIGSDTIQTESADTAQGADDILEAIAAPMSPAIDHSSITWQIVIKSRSE